MALKLYAIYKMVAPFRRTTRKPLFTKCGSCNIYFISTFCQTLSKTNPKGCFLYNSYLLNIKHRIIEISKVR